jgi:predicted DNA-binding protein
MGAKRRKQASGRVLKRTSVFLTTEQLARLAALHDETAVPVAVMIRRAVDAYLTAHRRG